MARAVVRAADSRRAFIFSTSSRRFSIASKRVRYPLTSRAMMSKSVNSEPRNADRLYPVDPARAGPARETPFARSFSPRAHRALVGRGLGPEPECRASQYILRRLGRENRLGLLPHPQPLADSCHETGHGASLRRFGSRNTKPQDK